MDFFVNLVFKEQSFLYQAKSFHLGFTFFIQKRIKVNFTQQNLSFVYSLDYYFENKFNFKDLCFLHYLKILNSLVKNVLVSYYLYLINLTKAYFRRFTDLFTTNQYFLLQKTSTITTIMLLSHFPGLNYSFITY